MRPKKVVKIYYLVLLVVAFGCASNYNLVEKGDEPLFVPSDQGRVVSASPDASLNVPALRIPLMEQPLGTLDDNPATHSPENPELEALQAVWDAGQPPIAPRNPVIIKES